MLVSPMALIWPYRRHQLPKAVVQLSEQDGGETSVLPKA